MSANSKEKWDERHKNLEIYWLTGSSINEIADGHGLGKIRKLKDKDILEIGVGTGSVTKVISKSNSVYCVDISTVAIENVKNIAKDIFTVDKIGSAPPVDIAICHLVFQHCSEEEILYILDNVNLKDDGFITFQSAELIKTSDVIDRLISSKDLYFRTGEEMRKIVELSKSLKIINQIRGKRVYKWENGEIVWWFFRCSKEM